MRILHIAGFYPEFGGPFTVVKALSTKLQEKGVTVHVLSPLPTGYDRNNLWFLNEIKFGVTYVTQELPRWVWPSFSLEFFSLVPKLAKQYDLIHLHGVFDMFSLPVFLSNTKYILTLHGVFMFEAYRKLILKRLKKDIFMKIMGKKILRKASVLHAVTFEEKMHFISFFPELKDKIVVIPNGLDLKYFSFNHENRCGAIKKEKKVLFLGRIKWIKGLDVLIRGLSKILEERQDIKLIIAGKDEGDGYEKIVRSWIKENKIDNYVTFTGFVTGEDKIRLLRECDVFILPSYSEALPTAVIEAMACGLPLIVSNRVGIYREIQEYKAGIVIEPTADGVYKGLKTWLGMKEEEVINMTDRARKMVEELYDLDKVAGRMIKLYEEILRGGELK